MEIQEISEEEIHGIFDIHDVDGSGKLNVSELGTALKELGLDLTDKEIAATFRIDDDPDIMNKDEFTAYVQGRILNQNVDFPSRFLECMQMFDENNEGHITRDDLKHILTRLGSPISEEEAEELLDDCDQNNDNLYDIHELKQFLYSI